MSFRISLPAWLPWKNLLFTFVFRKSLNGRVHENCKLVLVTRQLIVSISRGFPAALSWRKEGSAAFLGKELRPNRDSKASGNLSQDNVSSPRQIVCPWRVGGPFFPCKPYQIHIHCFVKSRTSFVYLKNILNSFMIFLILIMFLLVKWVDVVMRK